MRMREHTACNGKAGTIGYCLGGKIAYLMATRSDADCNVSYYGVGLDELLGEAANIANPLMLHIASKDQFVPPEAQEKIKAAMAPLPHVTTHVYEGQDHAFARIGGEHYDAGAATLANERSLAFLQGAPLLMTHAIRIHETGGPEVLSWDEIEVGDPGAGRGPPEADRGRAQLHRRLPPQRPLPPRRSACGDRPGRGRRSRGRRRGRQRISRPATGSPTPPCPWAPMRSPG